VVECKVQEEQRSRTKKSEVVKRPMSVSWEVLLWRGFIDRLVAADASSKSFLIMECIQVLLMHLL